MDETAARTLTVVASLGIFLCVGWFLISIIRAVFRKHRRSGLRQAATALAAFVACIVATIALNNHAVALEMSAAGVTTQEELEKHRAEKSREKAAADVIAAKEKAAADERAAEAARMERNRAAEEKRQAELDASRKAANEYIEALRREIISISKYSTKEWAESSAVALIFPPVWEGWATLYEKGSKLSLSAEQEAVRQTFKKSLSNKQVEIFPAQRNLYGPAMRKKLWEADGKASTFGPGYRTVEFVSAAFAANRNIKEIHQRMAPALMMFRFTRAQYKWVDANVEYSYYTLAPPKDSDVVIWSDDGSFRVL